MYVKAEHSLASRAKTGLAAVVCTSATVTMTILMFAAQGVGA